MWRIFMGRAHQKKRFLQTAAACFLAACLLMQVTACGIPATSTTDTTADNLPSQSGQPAAPTPPANDQVVFRGIPGDRKDRMMAGMDDPGRYNLNPFAEGEGLFPVDPSGYYQPVYQTLVTFDPEIPAYKVVLAESFQLSDLSLEIRMSDKKMWHDGYPIGAQDIAFTLNAHLKMKTSKGNVLERFISQITVRDEQTLAIDFNGNEKNAGWYVLDVLSAMPIVAEHVWEPVLSDVSAIGSLDETNVSVVGTGPWKIYQEDSFSITFSRQADAASMAGPLFFTILKYGQPSFARRALGNAEIDLLLSTAAAHGTDLTAGTEETAKPGPTVPGEPSPGSSDPKKPILTRVFSGEVLGGLAINFAGREELGLRAFRQLLAAASNPVDAESLSGYAIPVKNTDVLTVPSVMVKLDHNAIQSTINAAADDADDLIHSLMEKAGMTRQNDSGQLLRDGVPIDALTLIYPDHAPDIASVCEKYAADLHAYGLTIHLEPVPGSVWKDKLAAGDYELAYIESSVHESPVQTIARIGLITRSKETNSADWVPEFDKTRSADILNSFPAGNNGQNIIEFYQKLAVWMAQESLFIPLCAGCQQAALLNQTILKDLAVDSFFIYPVCTREVPASE